jgi:DNA polymerase III sliding clamp (beta) subunit (PCNA family)
MTTLIIKEWYWTPTLKSVQVLSEVAETQGWYKCSDGNQYQDIALNRIHPHTGRYASSPVEVMVEVEVDFKQFQTALKKAAQFRKVHSGKQVGTSAHEGGLLMCHGDKVKIVGCDGHMLAILQIDAKCTGDIKITLRWSTIKAILALNCAGLLTIVRRDGKELFRCGDVSLFQNTCTLRYGDVTKIIPRDGLVKECFDVKQKKMLLDSMHPQPSDELLQNVTFANMQFSVKQKQCSKILKALVGGVTVSVTLPGFVIMFQDSQNSVFLLSPVSKG